MELQWLAVGALQGTIVYNPDELWSLATVVTLCGVHRAWPVAAGPLHLTAHAPEETGWFRSFFRALLRLARPRPAKHDFAGLPADPLLLGGHKAQNIILDTRGMWTDSHEATSWAYKHLFTRCNHTHKTIAIQVQNSRRCVVYVPVAAILPYSRGLPTRHSPAVGFWPVHVYPTHTSGQTSHTSCCREHHQIKPHCSDAAMHLHRPQGSLFVTEPNCKLQATTGFPSTSALWHRNIGLVFLL